MHAETGVDLEALARVGDWICAALGRESCSRVARALAARGERH
jgi:hydroxymethylglutaryl-CoA lyase